MEQGARRHLAGGPARRLERLEGEILLRAGVGFAEGLEEAAEQLGDAADGLLQRAGERLKIVVPVTLCIIILLLWLMVSIR